MANKNWLIGFVFLALSAGTVFANGSKDDQEYVNPPRAQFDDFETETFEGRFSLVDNLYPALVTDGGETYYLMVHALLDDSSIPEEGAELTIEAVRSPMSPVNLMVFSAVVDGEELEFDAPFRGGPGGMMGRRGYDEGGWGYGHSNGRRR